MGLEKGEVALSLVRGGADDGLGPFSELTEPDAGFGIEETTA